MLAAMRTTARLAALALFTLTACPSERDRTCENELNSAQNVVKNVDAKSLDSVEQSLSAVGKAISACKKAEKSSEVSELQSAQRQLSGHLDLLREREADRARRQLALAELDRYVKQGDPNCPRGQAYKESQTNKEVRCTGPQPANMPMSVAEKYFTLRGYKVKREGNDLRAEYGSELYVFQYDSDADGRPPACLKLYPPPGMSWQEAVARFTGLHPDKLKSPGTVRVARGDLPLKVDEDEIKLIATIGTCH
jgi:hypothetical protein